MSNHSKIELAAKIRALLAKTVDNGCTEAEAMAAAAKAKQLMDEYQIDLDEAGLEAEGFVRGTAEGAEARKLNAQDWLANAISSYCEVKSWRTATGGTYARAKYRYVFFGLKSDVEFANWLLKALEAFCWQRADAWAIETGQGDYLSKRNFVMGCASRISQRLREEAAARKAANQHTATGKSLIVVKGALVDREFAKLGLRLRTASRSGGYRSGGSHDAHAAGRSAGDRASFGRPVSGGSSPKLIG